MKINEIAQILYDWNPTTHACAGDRMVFGDGDSDVKRAAVCCIATPNVIRAAKEWGAELIVTHEPTFHKYESNTENDIVAQKKKELIEDAGIPIFRIHDHLHFSSYDRIIEGVIKKLGWRGSFDGDKAFRFDEEKSAKEMENDFRDRLGLKNIRICGAKEATVKTVAMCVGAWGDENVHAEFVKPEIDAVVCGEITEWKFCEYARDAYELGIKKPLFLLGHMGSEKSGMEFVCEYLCEQAKEVEFLYIDCKEVFNEKK